MSTEIKLDSFLNQATEKVRSWPPWKRNMIGRCLPEQMRGFTPAESKAYSEFIDRYFDEVTRSRPSNNIEAGIMNSFIRSQARVIKTEEI